MATTVPCSFRIEKDVKQDLDVICREMGMSTATAFSLFAKRVVAERALPFTPAVVGSTNRSPVADALRDFQAKAAGYNVSEEEVLQIVAEGRHK